MIEVGLLGALGLTATLVAFLWWQARRAAAAADGELAAVRKSGELELQLAARGVAVADRDRVIASLTDERDRLNATVAELSKQKAQPSISTTKDASDAIKSSLATPNPRPGH